MSEPNSIDQEWEASAAPDSGEPRSATNPVVWSVNVQGGEVVDITHAELVERVKSGRLLVTTVVWRDGMEDWKAIDQFPEFESLVAEAPNSDSGLRAKYTEENGVGSDATPTHTGAKSSTAAVAASAAVAAANQSMGDVNELDEVEPDETVEANEPDEASSERDETSDVAKGFGFLAVYERPVATLDFAGAVADDDSEGPPSDALTPARHLEKKATPPRPAARKSETPLPPLPALRKAVQKAKADSGPKPPPLSAATAPASSQAVPEVRPATTPASNLPVQTSEPALDSELLAAHEVLPAASPPLSNPSVSTPTEAPVPPPPASIMGPPRPTIATLPPIIVREAAISPSDLVTSALPAPAPLDEATLVLGRRRTHRWVPLQAAILSAFGSACLASVLTWAIVRPGRAARATPPPVEMVKAPPVLAAPEPEPKPASATPPEPTPVEATVAVETGAPSEEPALKTAANDSAATPHKASRTTRSGNASDASGSTANAAATNIANTSSVSGSSEAKGPEDSQRQDFRHGLAEATKPASVSARAVPAPSARAGWPSNPGF